MGLTRQLIFGLDPDDGAFFTLSYGQFPDGNSTSKAVTCAVVPSTRGGGTNIYNDSVFLGTTSGAGVTLQTLRSDRSQDGTTAIVGSFITNRLDPDSMPDTRRIRNSTTKRMKKLRFHGFNPIDRGLDLTYAVDSDPIEMASGITWNDFEYNAGYSEVHFPISLANWIHLMGTESENISGKIILSNFELEYYTVGAREDTDA